MSGYDRRMTLTRREALAALACAGALPLVSGWARDNAPTSTMSSDADALALLDSVADHLLRLQPEAATSLGVDVGARAALRSQLTDRSAAGVQRLAGLVRADLQRINALNVAALSHPVRTSVEVVRSAYTTALEGFALPYGDITVGGWRNTPYVVIQNVGAYLDVPRFLDSDHRIDNAADADAYLSRLQSYAKQLDGELGRMKAARAAGLVPPAFLIDKAMAQMTLSARSARDGGTLVGSLARRTKEIPGNWAERARRIAATDVAPALERQLAELQAQRAVATDDPGIASRPHGDEFYRWALKASTTTSLSPDEVHEMGRSELQRLHTQMDAILKEIGYTQGTVGERMKALAKDPRYKFSEGDTGRAEIMAFINDRLDVDSRANAPRVQDPRPPEHGSQAAAARGRARRSGSVRRRGIDRRHNPRTVLDQSPHDGAAQQVQSRRPDIP